MVDSIEGYTILRELGRGGMGVVYAARDDALERDVAIKLVLESAANPELLLRFSREAELLARIRHPNVIRVHQLGRCARGPYMVTELVRGEELGEQLRRGPLEPKRAAEIVAGIADALTALHEAGILHRDLKPANVIVRDDGTPVLLDFGLAKDTGAESLTQTGALMGTPAYMSPEQANTDKGSIDERTDVYGAGAILYALLCGHRPFVGVEGYTLVLRIMDASPTWPEAQGLERVLKRAMAKNPQDRHPSAQALASDLRAFARGELKARTGRLALLVPALVVLILLAGLGGRALVNRPRVDDDDENESRTAELEKQRRELARKEQVELELTRGRSELKRVLAQQELWRAVASAKTWCADYGELLPKELESLRAELARRAQQARYWGLSGPFLWGEVVRGGEQPLLVYVTGNKAASAVQVGTPVASHQGKLGPDTRVFAGSLLGEGTTIYRCSPTGRLEPTVMREAFTCAAPVGARGYAYGTSAGQIVLLRDEKEEPVRVGEFNTGVSSITVGPRYLIATSKGDDKHQLPKVGVFDLEGEGAEVSRSVLLARATIVRASADGRWAAVGTGLGQASLIDLNNPKAPPQPLKANANDPAGAAACQGPIKDFAFTAERVYACSHGTGESEFRAWELETRAVIESRESRAPYTFLSVSPDGRWLLVGSQSELELRLLEAPELR